MIEFDCPCGGYRLRATIAGERVDFQWQVKPGIWVYVTRCPNRTCTAGWWKASAAQIKQYVYSQAKRTQILGG